MRRDVVVVFLLLATSAARAESPPPPPLSVYSVFDGQGGVAGAMQTAPDPGGGAGPSHVIDVVSGFVTVRDGGSGATVMSSTTDAFWTTAGVSGTPAAFSQHATFNAENQRWYISAEEHTNGAPNRIYLAVSATASALGPWKAITLPAQTTAITNTKLAVDPCGAYITGDTGGGSVVMAVPFSDLQWSGASAPTAAHLSVLSATAGVVPAIDPWNEIGSNARMFVARTPGSSSKIDVYKLHWASGLCASTLTATLAEPVTVDLGAGYAAPSRAAVQPSPAPGLAAGNGEIASATSSNGEIVGIATTEIGGQLAAFWFQLYADPTADITSLQQVGTITDPAADLIAPAIAFASYSGIAIVLVRTSAAEPPSIYVTGQPRGYELGSTQPLVLARGGTAAYSCAPAANVSAFGRYSSIASTATGFWAVAQYGASSTACTFGTAWVNFGIQAAPVSGDVPNGGGGSDDQDGHEWPEEPATGCGGCATGNDAKSSLVGVVVIALLLARRRRR